jgi:hypothetical protein
VFSILKFGKNLALPSSYQPISLLDTIGKLFEKILLSRRQYDLSEGEVVLCDEQFAFRNKQSTTIKLTHLLDRVSRFLDEKRPNRRCFLRCGGSFRHCMVLMSPV